MTRAKIILAGTAVLAFVSSAAFAQDAKPGAQDARTGMLTKIDRIHGTVIIQQDDKDGQSGTVGSAAGSAGEEFKIQGGLSLEDVHAGDKVSYSATDTGGAKTLTKIHKQKD